MAKLCFLGTILLIWYYGFKTLSFFTYKKTFFLFFFSQLIEIFIDITPNWLLSLHNVLKTHIKPPKNVANHLRIQSRQKVNSCNNEPSTISKVFVDSQRLLISNSVESNEKIPSALKVPDISHHPF